MLITIYPLNNKLEFFETESKNITYSIYLYIFMCSLIE